ncbi:MAG: phosphatidylserine decarboxylase, partial [Muriicola sp.]|nr:phosphatidylserine decarboxylase [Muriicola sp.]
MFHREGRTIILLTFFGTAIIILLAHFYMANPTYKMIIQGLALVVLILILQFFRNPKRISNKNFDEVHSPVDGKVVVIERVMEKEYFNEERLQISIFMSPVNVHVTRYPASGVIQYAKY